MTQSTEASTCGGHASSDAAMSNVNSDDMTTCPVMIGRAVNKKAAVEVGLFRDYEGERYYFCCAGCGPAWDSDPAKYAANMA